jgi:multidrug efflux pump subunit AcrB
MSAGAADNGRRMGVSGRLAAAFQANPLTPLLALAGLLLGLLAVLITPREEEPQIDVTMANVFVALAGASATDIERLVATPLEHHLSAIEGVRHVYSMSVPGRAVITVEFEVGVPRAEAVVRLYNQVYSNADWAPPGLGASPPLVRPMGIDDVPVMAVTLWTDDPSRGPADLAEVARALETELKRVPGSRDVYTIGAPQRAVLVELDAGRLARHGLTVDELGRSLAAANVVQHAGDRIAADGTRPLTAGTWLADAAEVSELVIGLADGRPLQLSDVATIRHGADLPVSYVWHGAPADRPGPASGIAPAVTLAISKLPGSNASDITRAVETRLDALRGTLIPDGVEVSITRDYGLTASDKAGTLIAKLMFATMTVVLLVLFTLGWREALVVGTAVVLTLALTLFASWAMGFTINRVSLFALIFSIGILVDDAIVVVENIHRHMHRGGKSLLQAIPPAVDEVGSPTILATFTVIAALLPMAFVSGLMGPYMRPIPINASVGMLLSLLIALTVTPWLSYRLLSRRFATSDGHPSGAPAEHGDAPDEAADGRLQRLFDWLLRPFLDTRRGVARRRLLFGGIVVLLALSVGLVALQAVVLKMLPFDNKSEFQVVVDLPEGSALERTNQLLLELATALDAVPEVLHFQGYAGTSAPVNFNGLVRQYYLRQGPLVGDLQVNLVDRRERDRKSHDLVRALRPELAAIGARFGASVKLVEVPPGPPVLAPLVAEIYGPDADTRRAIARELQQRFEATEGIVDVDSTLEHPGAERDLLRIDRIRAARLGISQQAITDLLATALSGRDVTYLHDGHSKEPLPLRLRLPASEQASLDTLLALQLRASNGRMVPLAELVEVAPAPWEPAIHHKDLLPVTYVTADEAGQFDSPLYGMFDLVGQLRDTDVAGHRLEQWFFSQPPLAETFAIKWDGEWQITFETFRDMGIAYAAGMLLIYLLVVAQFRSYAVPLVIMAPIPLTVIGVMPGHALLGAQFTATSMIGMIALAGIIVRNSILLVDFIQHATARGRALEDAVIEACAVRAQPIVLTALAAIGGALFILDDPIFNGLAIALISGILVSTALTLLVIPLLYYALQRSRVATA